MQTWDAEQLRAYLQHVREDRLFAAWFLAATTGMRRGEVLGLRREDVDLTAGTLAVRQAITAVGYRVVVTEPKTERSRRRISLDPATIAALRDHLKQQAKERLAWGPAYRDQGLVFAKEDGSPVHPDEFSKAFQRRASDAGLPRIRLHDLRHTYATLALAAGVHPKVVSDRLGHSTITLTIDTYSHSIPSLEEQAANAVADLIIGGEGRI